MQRAGVRGRQVGGLWAFFFILLEHEGRRQGEELQLTARLWLRRTCSQSHTHTRPSRTSQAEKAVCAELERHLVA